ncbi:protein shortage in chiasmata 1 ortholog [Periophthalmus magnuspinnatus]|uniref:protein shortage in chiasmata 1 ortholog n=1 Tax=Periophthalmus magnuspinnatus TaxID=409849 RepID=UPI002436756A|nr:protein shortage in chiasmata 1 ortholog [Periophthalmus magnuspinnatus]
MPHSQTGQYDIQKTSTSLNFMTDLLALPAPYLTRTNDHYPHSGHLPEDLYRTPWIRGKVVSMSKLFLNDSVLDDLRNNNREAINTPERYFIQEENEVIPSSNPDSPNELNISEAGTILTESIDPCQETFSKMQIEHIQMENEKKDLYLPEEILEVDYLKQFKRHLPSLKTKLSRLRMFPVEDPLSSLRHNNISEDMSHSCCEPYEISPQSFTRDNLSSTINLEEFSRAQLNDEKLILPNILESCAFEREDRTEVSKICDLLMIQPEKMNEQLSVPEIIQRANQDISQVEIYEPQTTETSKEGTVDTEATEQMKTSADLEVDLTLSPVRKDFTDICVSTSELSKEPLSPQGKISFGSLRDQRECERALWTAEKHPTFVLAFMLTDLDPLSTFMMLRSQQVRPPTPITVSPLLRTDVIKQVLPSEPQTTDQGQKTERLYLNASVSGNVSRDQSKANSKCMSPLTLHPNEQRQGDIVVEVQAAESQYHAFCEVLSFAQSFMSFVHKLGLDLKVWGDFRRLTMDQTHFLVKQQEKALSRTNSQNADLVKAQEQLFNEVTLIHALVTFKELLLKSGLSDGLEFLKKRNLGDEKRFKQFLKRLQIILYLSHKKQESNPKLLEFKGLLTTWFSNRNENTTADKILVLITNSDSIRSSLLGCLHELIGAAAVADLHLEKDKLRLNGASVVSSVCSRECALVCEKNIGPDFPWQCFSRLVEYDRPGPSPWAAVCRERGLTHVSFNTMYYMSDLELSLRRLEDSVSHVLFVTEGLLNLPALLQTLESTFNVTVLERNHSVSLQMLGGTHQYAVITVDESTAVIIQKQEELCQENASEALVTRLNALSLQYSCCWLILYCPDSRGGGLSSEAFNNLTLVYSSMVIFSMKSEDLDVKVLMVSEVLEMSKWISQICFHSLMISERDPAAYLDRDWLTVLESNEEKCLLRFPCINPLVSQLMLRRAPSLLWLLTAPLSELKEMLPEVPHKVLKLFSDTTSLYTHTSDLSKYESPALTQESVSMNHPNTSAWISTGDDQHLNMSPLSFPFGVQEESFYNTSTTEEPEPDVRFELTSSFPEPDVYKQKSWTISDLWKDDRDEGKASHWGGRSGLVGKMVGRADLRLPQHNSCITTHQMKYNSPFRAESTRSYDGELQLSHCLTPPGGEWGPELSPNFTFLSGDGLTRASATYGSKSFMGQERKRVSDAGILPVVTPVKRSRLSYEKVPGRRDGQTRLKLF